MSLPGFAVLRFHIFPLPRLRMAIRFCRIAQETGKASLSFLDFARKCGRKRYSYWLYALKNRPKMSFFGKSSIAIGEFRVCVLPFVATPKAHYPVAYVILCEFYGEGCCRMKKRCGWPNSGGFANGPKITARSTTVEVRDGVIQ